MLQKNGADKGLTTGAKIAQLRGELSKLKQFTSTAFEALGKLDRLINQVDFKLEAIEDQYASSESEEDYRYCEAHERGLQRMEDGSFQCPSCELAKLTGFPYECDEHGYHDGSCPGCEADARFVEERK